MKYLAMIMIGLISLSLIANDKVDMLNSAEGIYIPYTFKIGRTTYKDMYWRLRFRPAEVKTNGQQSALDVSEDGQNWKMVKLVPCFAFRTACNELSNTKFKNGVARNMHTKNKKYSEDKDVMKLVRWIAYNSDKCGVKSSD